MYETMSPSFHTHIDKCGVFWTFLCTICHLKNIVDQGIVLRDYVNGLAEPRSSGSLVPLFFCLLLFLYLLQVESIIEKVAASRLLELYIMLNKFK